MEQLKKICNVKIWLILLALIHTLVGVLAQTDFSVDAEAEMGGIFLVVSTYLFYAAFFTTGEAQARLAAVLTGPIWVWFMVCALFELESGTGFVWELGPELLPPLVFWGMTALSGLLHGNFHNLMPSEEA